MMKNDQNRCDVDVFLYAVEVREEKWIEGKEEDIYKAQVKQTYHK